MKRCTDCGYLAVRDEYDESVCEATEFTRTTGRHKSSQDIGGVANLFCFKASEAFPDIPPIPDIAKLPGRNPERQLGEKVNIQKINEEHDCPHFMEWRKGKTPKEHEEMVTQETVFDLKQQMVEFQKDQVQLTKQIAALSQVHHNENRGDRTEDSKTSNTQWWIATSISICAIIISILNAIFK